MSHVRNHDAAFRLGFEKTIVSAVTVLAVCLALVLPSLIMANPVEARSVVIHPPLITDVVNTPLNPPPGYSVNVTANVNSYPRSIAQVRLVFSSSSDQVNRTIQMVPVVANGTAGSFFAMIPSNVSLNGVTVTYFVVANDSSGFEGASEAKTFVVQQDHISPAFTGEYAAKGYLDTPILNSTDVEVAFNVTDSGSGVKRVFVLFSNSTDPTHTLTEEADLTLTEGDRFDGLWTGFMPPMSNGTVIYQAQAVDFSRNVGDSSHQSYQIGLMSDFRPNAHIQIVVQNLNLTSRMLTTYFVITLNSPTPYAENFLANVEIRQPSYDYVSVIVPRASGFFYQKSYTQEIPIYDVNLWPYDSYLVDLSITLYASGLNQNNTHVQLFVGGLAGAQFNSYIIRNETQKTSYPNQIQILVQMQLNRNASAVDIMQAIYAVFFVLGSVAWIRPTKISRRLELFVGLFTFVVVLFFTLTQILKSEGISEFIGLTVPQALLIGLIWSVTLLASASFAFGYLAERGWWPEIVRTHRSLWRHLFNFGLASIALLVTWYFSKIFVGYYSGTSVYEYFLFEIRDIWTTIAVGLFVPPIIAVELDVAAWASGRKMTRISERARESIQTRPSAPGKDRYPPRIHRERHTRGSSDQKWKTHQI